MNFINFLKKQVQKIEFFKLKIFLDPKFNKCHMIFIYRKCFEKKLIQMDLMENFVQVKLEF